LFPSRDKSLERGVLHCMVGEPQLQYCAVESEDSTEIGSEIVTLSLERGRLSDLLGGSGADFALVLLMG
jgi:hypothetical protein